MWSDLPSVPTGYRDIKLADASHARFILSRIQLLYFVWVSLLVSFFCVVTNTKTFRWHLWILIYSNLFHEGFGEERQADNQQNIKEYDFYNTQ